MPGEKFIKHNAAGGFSETEAVQTGGAPSADRIPSLNAAGRLDETMMPTGIGADTAVLPASGALAAGDFVNIFDNGGTPSVRKADASSQSTVAHGFVIDAFADGANATVYFEGTNTAASGLTAGRVFLSTTAGLATNTAPTASGEVVQVLGVAVAATQVNFEPGPSVLLA